MAQGYKGFAEIGRQANANIRRMKAEIKAREEGIGLQEPLVEEKEFSLSGGAFFKENPDALKKKQEEGYLFVKKFGTNHYSIDKFIQCIHDAYNLAV